MEQPENMKRDLEAVLALRTEGKSFEAAEIVLGLKENLCRELGQNHPTTIRLEKGLASIYRGQGRWAEASILERRIAELLPAESEAEREEALVTLDPQTIKEALSSMDISAAMNVDENLWGRAEKELEHALSIRRRVCSKDDPQIFENMDSLFWIYIHLCEWEKAENMKAEELMIRRDQFSASHASVLNCMADLARVYTETDRFEDAKSLLQQALDSAREASGSDCPQTLRCMTELSILYDAQDLWEDAESLQLEILATREQNAIENEMTVNARERLARTYESQNRHIDAERIELEIVQVLSNIIGEGHPDTLEAKVQLVSTYRAQGRAEEAKNLLDVVLDAQTEVIDEGCSSYLNTLAIAINLGQAPFLLSYYLELQEEYSSLAGDALDPTALNVPFMIAHSQDLTSLGKLDQAEDILIDAAELAKIRFGNDDPNTRTAREALESFQAAVRGVRMGNSSWWCCCQ